MTFKLDNIEIPEPHGFQISPFNIERSHTTANGTLVIDLIRRKSNFQINYDYLSASELALLKTIFASTSFHVLEYPEGGEQKQATVWWRNLPRSMTSVEPEEWEGVSITMEER